MGLFELSNVSLIPEAQHPFSSLTKSSYTHRKVSYLLAAIVPLIVVLLVLVSFLGQASQRERLDIKAAESLTANCYLLTRSGGAPVTPVDLQIIINVGELTKNLQRTHPSLLRQSSSAWDGLTSSVTHSGRIDPAVALKMLQLAGRVSESVKSDAHADYLWTLVIFLLVAVTLSFVLLTALKIELRHTDGVRPAVALHLYSSPVLDSLQEGILASDANGKLTLMNRAILDFHGLDVSTVAPNKWSNYFLLYSSDGCRQLDDFEHPLNRALRGEQIENFEVLVLNESQQARYCVVNGRPIHDRSGRNLGALIVLHDVSERRRTEQEVARLASIVECSTDAVVGVNLDGAVVSWNAAATQLFGYTGPEIFGRPASLLARSGDSSAISEAIKTIIRGDAVEPMELSLRGADEQLLTVSLRYSRIEDSAGNLIGVSAAGTDISKRKRDEAALFESQKQLAEAQRVARMGSWEFDIETGMVSWSLQMYRLFDFDPLDGVPSYAEILKRYHPDDNTASKLAHDSALCSGQKYEVDIRLILPSGEDRYCQVVGQPVVNADGKIARMLGTAMDITERKQAETVAREATVALEYQKRALEEANRQLESLATSDGLTGLKNRRLLDSQLELEFARSSRYRVPLTVILLDIDNFKNFNDSFGHQAGDDVLRMVSNILTHGTRDSDIVARYGGEEICIVLPETRIPEARQIAERLRISVANAEWDRRQVTVSLGVATFHASMDDVSDLILSADRALYVSKHLGRNRVTVADSVEGTQAAA